MTYKEFTELGLFAWQREVSEVSYYQAISSYLKVTAKAKTQTPVGKGRRHKK